MSRPAFRTLEPGDPWTFIRSEPICDAAGDPVSAGDLISSSLATTDTVSVFRITRITGTAYETVFVGIEPSNQRAGNRWTTFRSVFAS